MPPHPDRVRKNYQRYPCHLCDFIADSEKELLEHLGIKEKTEEEKQEEAIKQEVIRRYSE